MRITYTLLWVIALPFVLLRLYWRGRMEPGYRQHIAERFGFYRSASQTNHNVIWVHAVSVGETRAAEPLIRQLQLTYPLHRILLTHMTPTGRATGALLFPNNEVQQAYLPYDIPCLVQGLLSHFQPLICILMETEVWPNLIHTCQKKMIPIVLVNARLSPKSFKKGLRLPSLIRPAASAIASVLAQTEADAERLRLLGANNVIITGNIKFDLEIRPEQISAGLLLREQIGTRPVFLCASTREGEEESILDAFATNADDALLIIVPRHPQRFDRVAQLIQERSLTMARRSTLAHHKLGHDVRVLLGDTMGELISYYASSDLAFIGGSLLPLGGQNVIEALAVGKPVFIGPHTFNFDAICTTAVEANCALRVKNANELIKEGVKLILDEEKKLVMSQSALSFAQLHRGATKKTVELLKNYIN